ncbi:DUF3577 domain-containing protein [Cardiobacterium valvarum]|uniref:Uncharacterized protein n=1 Tax=Cardiobacterium valvarum F0432 TaxID=797473 RepID=G9ZG44_9GAMM|nr:DUF3577 domain-containing protein [Cardiobacterium valvarum]EHM53400.1 hypothetical protein HMPREF9080_01758 [Cardiobacterium valvarum F0432]
MNATQLTTAGTKSSGFFDIVMYARAYINEIKIITPAKGPKYCALNASVLDVGCEGKTLYRSIDLIASGEQVKGVLRGLMPRWPQDRMNHSGPRWAADINIGSIRAEAYLKKDGNVGAVFKGRLINIRALRIADEQIVGDGWTDDIPPPTVVAPGFINQIDPEKGIIRFAAQDGKIGASETRNMTLSLAGEIPAISELIARGLIPRGYAHRATNPHLFANLAISGLFCEGFKGKDGKPAAALKGVLTEVRYLKANDNIIVSGQKKQAAA